MSITPNGGIRSEIVYLDITDKPTEKDNVVKGLILEYDKDNNIIFTTYFIIDNNLTCA